MASAEFIAECRNGAYKNRLGTVTMGDTDITQSDTLSSLKVTSSIYSNGTIIGSINIKQADVELLEITDYTGLDFSLKAGVRYDDDTTEYVNLGEYTCLTPEINETSGNTTISEYDILRKVDDTYQCNISDWDNVTLKDVLEDICTSLGLTLKNETFLNSDFIVEGNPFTNGETYREPLSDIAEIACSWVTIDLDTGELELCWFDDSTIVDTLDKSQYTSLTLKGTYGPVNVVTIKETQIDGENVSLQDDESIETYGETELCIKDNYFLDTEDKRQSVIDSLFEKLDGFTYAGYELTCYYGKPHIKVGDRISIQSDDGEYFETYVLNNVFKYDGSFYSEMTAELLSDEETTQRNSSQTLKELLSNTAITVDKVNKNIEAIIEEQTNMTSTITSLTMTTDDIQSQVSTTNEVVANLGSQLSETNDTLSSDYEELLSKFDDYATTGEVNEIVEQVTTQITDTYSKTEIQKILNGTFEDESGEVVTSLVRTTTGQLDEDGLSIQRTNANTDIALGYKEDSEGNELEGLIIYDTGSTSKELLFAGYDSSINQTIVRADNINITTYATIGSHSRLEDYEDGTGVFYL